MAVRTLKSLVGSQYEIGQVIQHAGTVLADGKKLLDCDGTVSSGNPLLEAVLPLGISLAPPFRPLASNDVPHTATNRAKMSSSNNRFTSSNTATNQHMHMDTTVITSTVADDDLGGIAMSSDGKVSASSMISNSSQDAGIQYNEQSAAPATYLLLDTSVLYEDVGTYTSGIVVSDDGTLAMACYLLNDKNISTWKTSQIADDVTSMAIDSGAKTFTRTGGTSFVTLGFKVGQDVVMASAEDSGNNGTYQLTAVTSTVLTVSETVSTTNADDTAITIKYDGVSAGWSEVSNINPTTSTFKHVNNPAYTSGLEYVCWFTSDGIYVTSDFGATYDVTEKLMPDGTDATDGAFDSSGNLYCIGDLKHIVWKSTDQGVTFTEWFNLATYPPDGPGLLGMANGNIGGICIDRSDNIYILSNASIDTVLMQDPRAMIVIYSNDAGTTWRSYTIMMTEVAQLPLSNEAYPGAEVSVAGTRLMWAITNQFWISDVTHGRVLPFKPGWKIVADA